MTEQENSEDFQKALRRLRLRVATKLLLAIGFLMVLYVGLSAFLSSDESTRVMPTQVVDVSSVEPGQAKTVQPNWAKNALRSRREEWFVSIGVGTDFSCPIVLLEPTAELFQGEVWSGGFADDCRGSRYDLAGRVYANQYADKNLIVPDYAIKEMKIVLGAN